MKKDERKYLLSLTNDMFDKEARVCAIGGGVYKFDGRFYDRKMKENYLDCFDDKIRQLSESNELKSVDWSRNMGKQGLGLATTGYFYKKNENKEENGI